MTRHGNVVHHRKQDQRQPTVRKVPVDSVSYGSDISRNGKTVWAAYSLDGALVCLGATAEEARAKYRSVCPRP